MSLKNMEVYEYKRFVIFFIFFLNRSSNCFKNSINAMSAPEAAAVAARFVTRLTSNASQSEGICRGEPRQINSGLMSECLVFMFLVYCRKTLK